MAGPDPLAVAGPEPRGAKRTPSDAAGDTTTVDGEGSAATPWTPVGELLQNEGHGNCLVLALSQLDLGGTDSEVHHACTRCAPQLS